MLQKNSSHNWRRRLAERFSAQPAIKSRNANARPKFRVEIKFSQKVQVFAKGVWLFAWYQQRLIWCTREQRMKHQVCTRADLYFSTICLFGCRPWSCQRLVSSHLEVRIDDQLHSACRATFQRWWSRLNFQWGIKFRRVWFHCRIKFGKEKSLSRSNSCCCFKFGR